MQETKSYSDYFTAVKNYIELEYDQNILQKLEQSKFSSIVSGFVRNCLSLKKTIPYTAGGLVKFLSTTK